MNDLEKSNVLVSICCTAYNHEKYIDDALRGFVEQKTNFEFEVLIHDDASTDKTTEIIKKYELEYPNIIKPIYQKENQYSKGIPINRKYNYSRAKGKYIALCEGDDYWIDPLKLQKQIDYMEANPNCTFCFTNGKILDVQDSKKNRVFIPFSKENEQYFYNKNKSYDVGSLGLLGFIPTASFVFRKLILDNPPKVYLKKYPAGDMKLKLYATAKGYAYFINDVTTVYRTNVRGSAMTRWKSYNSEQLIEHNQGYIDLINDINEYTNFQYSEELDKLKAGFEASNFLIKKQKNFLKQKKYREWFKKQHYLIQIKIITSLFFPNFYNVLKRTMKLNHSNLK